MDTLIKQKTFLEKLAANKAKAAGYAAAIVLFGWLFESMLTPSVSREFIQTATAFRGDLVTEIEGSGTVQSSGMELYYSPSSTYVKAIYKREGQHVSQGDTVLVLEATEIETVVSQLGNQIRIDENALKTKQIEFEELKLQNKRNVRLAESDLKQHEYEYDAAIKLRAIGGIAEGDVKARAIQLERDKIELDYLKNALGLSERKLRQEIETLKLQIANKQSELAGQRRRLAQSVVRATVDGAVISQPVELGQKVSDGELVSQISNLKEYVIEARFNQRRISAISAGMAASVRIGQLELDGQVELVQLEVKDGYGIAEIKLVGDVPNAVRQNQTAQVYVQTGMRKNVLLVNRGAFISAGGRVAFVLEDKLAKRRDITLGERNATHVELRSGIAENETLIISRIEDYLEYQSFEIEED